MDHASSIILAAATLMAVTWGPTLLAFRRIRQRPGGARMSNLVTALLMELAVVLVAGAVVDRVGVPNPGAYLLIITLIVGAVGSQVYARRQA